MPNSEVGKDIVGNGHDNFVQDVREDFADGNCLQGTPDEQDALGNSRPTYGQVVARMPTDMNSTHYNMNHNERGHAYIFNHETFNIPHLKKRSGTIEDCKNLEQTLKEFGFKVSVFLNLEYSEIRNHVEAASRTDHNNKDCLLICILSHGEEGIVYAKDVGYKPDFVWSCFTADRCPSLAGKPKIFLFQACQGDRLDSGVTLQRTETDGRLINSYRIPSHADFLIIYSTVKGYYSWRNTTRGSWFVQALCRVLKEIGHQYDFLTILTFVSQKVAIEFESNVPDNPTMHQQKQIPCVLSMLTRLIQFTRRNQV